ncbi:hypothetical protein JTB14_014425 [Gonioctena quinquepunctata]|nr:hypothetical protein JTB14_014425 [Gonioctena quinquepunctata]
MTLDKKLNYLGADPSEKEIEGRFLHFAITSRWNHVLVIGLDKTVKADIRKIPFSVHLPKPQSSSSECRDTTFIEIYQSKEGETANHYSELHRIRFDSVRECYEPNSRKRYTPVAISKRCKQNFSKCPLSHIFGKKVQYWAKSIKDCKGNGF